MVSVNPYRFEYKSTFTISCGQCRLVLEILYLDMFGGAVTLTHILIHILKSCHIKINHFTWYIHILSPRILKLILYFVLNMLLDYYCLRCVDR